MFRSLRFNRENLASTTQGKDRYRRSHEWFCRFSTFNGQCHHPAIRKRVVQALGIYDRLIY